MNQVREDQVANKGTRTDKYTAVASSLLLRARGLALFNRTGPLDMVVAWSLFASWVILNLLDVIISLLATQAGAIEVGLLYQLGGTFSAASINKMMLATLIGFVLLYYRKSNWLSLLNLGMLGLCTYNVCVLFSQVHNFALGFQP